jgi:hypothetical protein
MCSSCCFIYLRCTVCVASDGKVTSLLVPLGMYAAVWGDKWQMAASCELDFGSIHNVLSFWASQALSVSSLGMHLSHWTFGVGNWKLLHKVTSGTHQVSIHAILCTSIPQQIPQVMWLLVKKWTDTTHVNQLCTLWLCAFLCSHHMTH